MRREVNVPRAARPGVGYDALWKLALALPGVEEGTSYGTPAFKVGGKFLARLKEDGDSLVLKIGFAEREALIESQPEVFYITDHYLNYPSVLVRLSRVSKGMLAAVIEEAWRFSAPAKVKAPAEARPRDAKAKAKAKAEPKARAEPKAKAKTRR